MLIVVEFNVTIVSGLDPEQVDHIRNWLDGESPGDVLEYVRVAEAV